jgi:hypothetical protein
MTTDAASTVNPNNVPFGIFKTSLGSTNVEHTILVATNAQAGYGLTLVENNALTSGTSTVLDFGTTSNGAGTAWTQGTSTGFGVNAFGTEVNTTNFGASTTQPTTLYKALGGGAVTIASTSGVTAGNTTTVDYRVATPALQAAGNYTNTLTYTCTGNY